jgi:hypothetical protein
VVVGVEEEEEEEEYKEEQEEEEEEQAWVVFLVIQPKWWFQGDKGPTGVRRGGRDRSAKVWRGPE